MPSSTPTPAPKKFLNNPVDAVSELISGLLIQYPNTIRKLANHNVILSSTISHDKVNILSGGGSGHEPSHAGWIGNGMLSGAILGGIFASPSVASILAAIRAVTHINAGKGCLLVVKNYTGDRLNFGMACEIANAEGRQCAMVVVADDSALERTKGVTGARGVAGTVFVHKVAGAAALNGCSLSDVVDVAQDMANRVRSLGVALDAVTIPGANVINDRLDAETIEIGLGIHGEAGIRQSKLKTADELATIMVDTILKYGRDDVNDDKTKKVVPTFQKGDELAIMINNLGGTSNFEMSILANSVVKYLENETTISCKVTRVYVGSFMTSFDMQGASVSIISLTAAASSKLSEYLDEKTNAPAWLAAEIFNPTNNGDRPSSIEYPEIEAPAKDSSSSTLVELKLENFTENVTASITSACNKLIESEPILTKYDTIVGDGDCGLTMERGAREILSRLVDNNDNAIMIDTSHPVPLFESLATAVSASMGGTSGVLLELMFRKMSTFLNSGDAIDAKRMKEAFEAGVEAISFYGGATVGSRTMLDALVPAVNVLNNIDTLISTVDEAAKAAVKGADGTASMSSASAGRSNYLSEDALNGTPDPGAVAVGLVLTSICDALKSI